MSIFDDIGGDNLVSEAVDEFYGRLIADPDLLAFFGSTDVAQLKTHQRMFMTAALGGPDAYEGRDMRAAHAHLRVTDADFDQFIGHLAEALTSLGADPAKIADLLEALEPLRWEIVSGP